MVSSSLTFNKKCGFEASNSWNKSLIMVMPFPCYLSTSHHFCFFSRTCNNVINLMFILYSKQISIWIFVYTGPILPRLFIELSFFWLASVVTQLTLSNSNFSLSSIPRIAGPFLGTTKKLYSNSTCSCLIVTLHTPNCGALELLYIDNQTFFVCIFI